MTARQVVRVFSTKNPITTTEEIAFPQVFFVNIRNDLVQDVFSDWNKNRRQPYAVNKDAGMLYNAESWGTGRAVARVPRVGGSGTHRSGQGAFANSCRGGRMFNPTTVWRRWNRKVNLTKRRHAVASALAASAVPSLVLARGHRVNQVPEIPLVLDSLQISTTKELLTILSSFGLDEEISRVRDSKKVRPGAGKQRNRRYKMKRGPLVIYDNSSVNVVRAARNIPGVDVCHVDRLNILQLCPGGHLGRLIVWTKEAFKKLDFIFGTFTTPAEGKKGYVLERPMLTNANIARIINSDDIQSIVQVAKKNVILHDRQKKNPLTNTVKMNFLNPYAKEKRAEFKKAEANSKASREERRKKRISSKKSLRKHGRNFISNYHKDLEGANKRTIGEYTEYIRSTKIGKEAIKDQEE